MAATPEKKVKMKVEAVLKSEGAYYFFPATHGYGRSGVPDIICCVGGSFLAIECKANGGKATALQIREIEMIRRNGGTAVIVDETNWEMVRDLLRRLKAGTVMREQTHE